MKKQYEINFECPKCHGENIEEKEIGVIQYTQIGNLRIGSEDNIEAVYPGEVTVYEHTDSTLAEVEGYVCQDCEFKIADTLDELYKWLKEHKMLKER